MGQTRGCREAGEKVYQAMEGVVGGAFFLHHQDCHCDLVGVRGAAPACATRPVSIVGSCLAASCSSV